MYCYVENKIDKEDILRLTDRGLSVFKHYIPVAFRLGKNFLNPFYQDNGLRATCIMSGKVVCTS